MTTLSLHGAEFFAFHGFYPEEQLLGSKFIVDVDVDFTPAGNPESDEIANTVDYELVYAIVEEKMKNTVKLIETLAHEIANEIKMQFSFVNAVRISVKKLNPPLRGKVKYAEIVITV